MAHVSKAGRNDKIEFDQRQFNAKFEVAQAEDEKGFKQNASADMVKKDEILTTFDPEDFMKKKIKLPHQRPIEDIIIISREMFYKCLEMLVEKKNPYNYIMSSPDRFFTFSLVLIILGSTLLLMSNIFSSKKNL